MLDEPQICRHQYQEAQVAVLAHSAEEALALVAEDAAWDPEELRRLAPEVVPLDAPRIVTRHIDPF
jgi:hypothetical protein